ncbi:MAG: M14 family zinc carboxypeptidase [Acidobacteriota bacterium]
MRHAIAALILCTVGLCPLSAEIPTPATVFGHEVGADFKLIPYPGVLSYLETVAAESDRVTIEEAGRSTLDNPMKVVILTSPENQANLGRLREIARLIAKPGDLTPEQSENLVDEGKVIALVTCSIHSTEVGSTQMVTEFVYEFATTEDPEKLAWMDDVVLLIMPSINPDGQLMVVDWYNKWLGTEYEGGRMPWLYHHYVGHDNNRDFYMLSQRETKVVNDVLYHRWFPQSFLDEHQMGSTGPRMFVPPQTDPLNEEVHSLVFRQADVLGTNMSFRLEQAEKTGVGHNMIFDSYWPGGTRNTAWWKNVTGLLTEVASARLASPIYIDPGELRGGGKGFPEYGRRSNFPSPWPGGWWRLRDIVEYELVATWAFLEANAENRASILGDVNKMARWSIENGLVEPPYAFVIPPAQHDPVAAGKLVDLLLEHGIEIARAMEPVEIGYSVYPAGTTVIPAAQPYRPFLLTMLRSQRYPEVRNDTDAGILAPYDVASWSLPLAMGVEVVEATEPVNAALTSLTEPSWPQPNTDSTAAGHLIPAAADSAYQAINRLLADGKAVHRLDSDAAVGIRGDVYLSAEDIDASSLAEIVDDLHLPVTPVASVPEASLLRVEGMRVGLFKPWVASMDEGWTRFVLEDYEFPLTTLSNEMIRSGDFAEKVDVLLFPDISADIISKGEPEKGRRSSRRWAPMPPEYAGGIDSSPEAGADGEKKGERTDGIKGGKRIREWVEAGGTVVALESSSQYFIDLFELPVSNVLEKVRREDFNCPGSMLRVEMDLDSPLSFGMRSEEAVYFAGSPAFRTQVPDPRFERDVVARYPDDDKDILISGYLEGGDLLEKRAAVVDFRVGDGRVILIGFRAQHRAQPVRTFKLLFNTLYSLKRITD